jgi:L-methionine (R)-S-oxide reductase
VKPLPSDLKAAALSLIEGERNLIANLANLSSLIFTSVSDLNWAGFYLWDSRSNELVLGPFQGKPACIRIRPDRGVCGKAWSTQQPQLVPDVFEFPGHIACDSASRSELVIPLVWPSGPTGSCVGVLDLDSPSINRFSSTDRVFFEELVRELMPRLWPNHTQIQG